MKRLSAFLAAVLAAACMLTACSEEEAPAAAIISGSVSASGGEDAAPVPGESSDEEEEETEDIESVNYADAEFLDTMSLDAHQQFYLGFATSLEINMTDPVMAFQSASQLDDRTKYQYFTFLNSYLSFITGTDRYADWQDAENGVWRIPVSAIRSQLETYLGTGDFDPVAAFGSQMINTSYADVPLGYDAENDCYVTRISANLDGLRAAQLLAYQQEGDEITAIIGFYDISKFMGEVQEFVLQKTYTLHIRELSFDDKTFTLESAYFTSYDADGPTGRVESPQAAA